jgi:hypothetical protein
MDAAPRPGAEQGSARGPVVSSVASIGRSMTAGGGRDQSVAGPSRPGAGGAFAAAASGVSSGENGEEREAMRCAERLRSLRRGLTLCGAAAMAQAPTCGGIGAEGAWIAGDPAASDIALAPEALTRAATPVPENGDSVSFFSLASPMAVRIEAQASGPTGDPVIELYDAAGIMVVTDDDSGGGLSSRAETELAAGQYCLLVRGFADSPLTADIRVGRLEHEALTVGLRGGFTDPFGDGTGPTSSASSPACRKPRPAP